MSVELVLFLFLYLPAYLLGSIPFGLILTKIFTKKDIRKVGSGNIGATNVLRAGGIGLAMATLLLDGGKGFLSGFFSLSSAGDPPSVYIISVLKAGFWIILGHCFPVWLKFKGGKGVATAFGVLLAATPLTALAVFLGWIATFTITRISSLSALIACAIAPVATLFIYGSAPAAIVLLISALVILRHHANIKRLLKGEESKFTSKKKDKDVIASE